MIIPWDRTEFDDYDRGLSKERRRGDSLLLSGLYDEAAEHVPTLWAGLEWAWAHGVVFIVDPGTKDLGYYQPGTGVVALQRDMLKNNMALAVDTATHEIRHAWHDAMRLCPDRDRQTFLVYYISDCMLEADADAMGYKARQEHLEAHYPNLSSWFGPRDYMDNHKRWYWGGRNPLFYGRVAIDVYIFKHDLPDKPVAEDSGNAFVPQNVIRLPLSYNVPGQIVEKINEDFNGKSLFRESSLSATLHFNKVCSPRRAARLYKGMLLPKKERDLVRKICRREGVVV